MYSIMTLTFNNNGIIFNSARTQNTSSTIAETEFCMKGGSLIDGENYITQ